MATVRENIKNALNWFYDRLKDKYLDPFNERITTNTNNIATNTANIETNTANIEKNTTDISQLNSDLSGKAPTSHASSDTTYGVGTTSNYGHCRTINNLTTSSHTNGYALSAYQGYVLNSNISNKVTNSGDTMTGRLTVSSTANPLIQLTNTNTSSGDTFMRTTSWSGKAVAFGIGSGGENRGIYDYESDSWMVYSDSSNAVHLNGTTTVGGTAKPIYFNSGVPTAISSTVGGVSQPVYLNGGTVTACTSTTSGSWYIRHGWAWRSLNAVAFSSISLPSSYLPITGFWANCLVEYNSGFYFGTLFCGTGGLGDCYYYPTVGGRPTSMPSSAELYGYIVYRYQ